MFASTDQHKAGQHDPYASAIVTDTAATGNTTSPFETKKQPNQCRDPLFAGLFYVNIVVIGAIAAVFGSNPFNAEVDNNNNNNNDDAVQYDYTPFMQVAFLCGGIGIILTVAALNVLLCIPGILIKVALITNILLILATTAAAFYYGSAGFGVICLILFAITCCYTYCIWSRIPFATANLKTGCTAIKANCGVSFIAYIMVVASFAWTLLWTVTLMGVQDSIVTCEEVNGQQQCTNINYLYLFFLLISYYFTHQVLQNTVHTTVAGVVGTWWFIPDESGFCGKAVCGSFFRTITTSFGSVCFGSLIVSIIEATRQIVETARQNDDIGAALACCIDCILSCIQGLVEYFNKWAYVYVGLYGYGYCEAGKNVMQLFRDRGWEAIIADDIVTTVLFLVSLVSGLITAAVGVLASSYTNWFDLIIEQNDGDALFVKIICGIIGFIIGYALCAIIMGVISSSVNATIVLFAEAPAEFESHYPELSQEMRKAYLDAHPGCL